MRVSFMEALIQAEKPTREQPVKNIVNQPPVYDIWYAVVTGQTCRRENI